MLHHRPGIVECAGEIRIDDLPPGQRIHVVQRAVALDTGVVDQDVDRSQPALDVPHHLLGAGEVAYIRLVRGRDGRQALRCRLIAGVSECYLVTGGCELLHDGAADAAAASGDQCDAHFGRFLP